MVLLSKCLCRAASAFPRVRMSRLTCSGASSLSLITRLVFLLSQWRRSLFQRSRCSHFPVELRGMCENSTYVPVLISITFPLMDRKILEEDPAMDVSFFRGHGSLAYHSRSIADQQVHLQHRRSPGSSHGLLLRLSLRGSGGVVG